ncbi:MAG: DUF4114 domain-containing protein [Cyanobacteria bacterium P01_E01_bin.42]
MLLVLNLLSNLFRHLQSPRKPSKPRLQTLILEPILTPSAFVDNPNDPNDDVDIDIDGDDFDGDVSSDDGGDDASADNAPSPISVNDYEISSWITADNAEYPGTFIVGETGEVGIDFLFDGGAYQGEIAIFSLEGMEYLDVDSPEFIRLAADRALSDSPLGHVVIQDLNEGAKFSHSGWEPDFNAGDYQGVKTVTMNRGDRFAVMLVPNGTVEEVFENPEIGGNKTPLFSLDSANPEDGTYLTRMADVTGDGNTFAMEDWRLDANSDRDYNDVVFQIRGAKGDAPLMDEMVDPGRDWRNEDFGQALVSYAQSYIDGTDYDALDADSDLSDRPLVGIIDTGFSSDSDIDYAGSDLIDGDDNPFFAEGEGDSHGDRVLESFSEVNDKTPIWVGRAVGSGRWAESLVEFVDAARESGQPNAVVNLSMDLTQIDAEGNISTRYEFTPLEMAALEYARQNDVLVAVAAGNEGGVMSALGQASEQFDHIITVGAAEEIDADVPVWQGSDRADYSSYGTGLDIVADGTLGDAEGTSLATARVAGAASRVWAANPDLSYQQVIEALRETAIDLNAPGWDVETGAGLLNLAAAVQLAKTMQEEEYEKELQYVPLTWSGEGEVTPMERAANNGVSGSGSGSSPSWDSFLGIFGSYSSPNWHQFLRRIYDRFYKTPKSSNVPNDFNGDGQSDILWRHQRLGHNSIWLMGGQDGHEVLDDGEIPTIADLDWKIVGTGDFNGDGQSDILWRHQRLGHNSIWLMGGQDGHEVLDDGEIPTIADLDWKIVPDRENSGTFAPDPDYVYKDADYLKALYQDNVANGFSRKVHWSNQTNSYTSAFDSDDSAPNGVDFDNQIYALVGGEVIEAKNGQQIKDWGYNGTVAIYNQELNKTFIYWHLAENSINEDLQGQIINAGFRIGIEGNTGSSYGNHTHVEIHEGRAYVDMSNPSDPKAPGNGGRLDVASIFQEAVRRGLVKRFDF